ncbi:MAG TPA: DoxX family membrane protein, partial [Pyrinomonadaceae bacterium]
MRLALGAAFLSAVADRFGLWGAYGEPGVAWGDFAHFTAYTATLNWFAPAGLIPALAWAATVAEVALGLGLILGLYTRASALLSGLLLLLFAAAMTLALGVKAPLNYS